MTALTTMAGKPSYTLRLLAAWTGGRVARLGLALIFLGSTLLVILHVLGQTGNGTFEAVESVEPVDNVEDLPPRRKHLTRDSTFEVEIRSASGQSFWAEELLTFPGSPPLRDRLQANVREGTKPKIILSWNAGHSSANLGGCPDWNCEFTLDQKKLKEADAVLAMHTAGLEGVRPDQYLVFFSQESPVHTVGQAAGPSKFNFSLNYRHDSPAASPYGYTVKLAPRSRPTGDVVNLTRLAGKTKSAAWFVSHCGTNSRREDYIRVLQKYIPVDVYGSCGPNKCARGGACENMLDNDYFFYIAFENSVCRHYITEKIWNQGYARDIVPVVLSRSMVKDYVPPNSFIAADDFSSPQKLAEHMRYLMQNATAYSRYFEWRRTHRVVFLNGREHDGLERPWGFCQLCRLLWEKPRPTHIINDFSWWWTKSCSPAGAVVKRLLESEKGNSSAPIGGLSTWPKFIAAAAKKKKN